MKAFIDCMIFLHYQSIETLDLCKILAVDEVSIVVPRITLRELDKHKNTHSSQKIRDRASRILQKIEQWTTKGTAIRSGVSAEVFLSDPGIDYAVHDLNPSWNDDVLIASILQYKLDNPGEAVILITQDSGPKLTGTHLGIPVSQLPEEYRLPEELDPLEAENRELKQVLAKLQNALPKLFVCFATAEDPGNFARFVLSAPSLPRETDIEQTVDELRDQYPKQYPSRQPGFVGARGELGFIPPGEHERYNRDVDRFLGEYKKFMHDTDEMEAAFKRCIRFQIEIHNKGTAPADDVDVSFHFPDGFQLFSKDNLPANPEKPYPPIEPRTTSQIMMDNASRVLDSGISSAMDREFKLPESFSIKRTNSYNVTDHFDRIKHGDHKRLRELFLIFDSYESASPFTCDFNLRVANLPKPVTGQLHFVIEREK